MTLPFRFRTKPFEHQEKVLAGGTLRLKNPVRDVRLKPSLDRIEFGLFHEPGLGKTKTALDTLTYHVDKKNVRGLLVLAPNGVHRNWSTDEIPTHLPEDLLKEAKVHCWLTSKKATREHRSSVEALLRYDGPLAVLLVSYDALMTDDAARVVRAFLDRFPSLYVADESHFIKSPNAKRTKRALASAKYARIRRILTGTFVSNSPFDAYSQMKFLREDMWREIGCGTAAAFRNVFGEWERKYNSKQGRFYDDLKAYKNLDLLHEYVDRFGSRLVKDDVLDLPPKVYSRRYFDLNATAARAYRDLREAFLVERESGLLTAPLAISRLVRLQQCTSGWLPASDEDRETLLPLGDTNPRLACLLETIEETKHVPTIIWTKYDQDVDLVLRLLKEEGIEAVRYDGSVNDDERLAAKIRFQKSGDAQVFVSKASVGGSGLTLTRAHVEVFYNTTFNPSERIQAEDRAHRIGLDHPLFIIDLVGLVDGGPTVDGYILDTLKSKQDVSAVVMGDNLRGRI